MIVLVLAAALATAPTPPTSAPTSPTSAPVVLGLVVTSNRSLELGRSDLSYADDDGVRWAELFATFAAPGDVELLTTFDADSARLYADRLATTPAPTRANVAAAARRLSTRAATARAAGHPVDLFVVYAGHGDVDRGRGFVSLADGAFTADDLRALLASIPTTRTHVVLDSCNSFFLIQPRKPGGRRFATPRDAALGLERTLPGVGVFLSTSAEAEVYEWSELQSGIFSHVVRSGLAGGADVNADRRVTYDELEAFVGVATAELKNPALRPRVFARGQRGRGDAVLVDLRAVSTATSFQPEPGARVTVRDAVGIPVFDVHAAADAPITLLLPAPWVAGATVETRTASGSARRSLDPSVPAADRGLASRGAEELLGALFQRPFGPAAMTAWVATRDAAPPPVYGIGQDDIDRMRVILDHIGAEQRAGRLRGGLGLLGVGALSIGASTLIFDPPSARASENQRPLAWTLLGVGVGAMIGGGVALVLRSDGERLRERFELDLQATTDPAALVARTEERLDRLAADYRSNRRLMLVAGITVAAAGAVGLVANELRDSPDQRNRRLTIGSMTLLGALIATFSAHPFPIESFIHEWHADPGLARLPRLVVAPGPVGDGLGLGVAGTFY